MAKCNQLTSLPFKCLMLQYVKCIAMYMPRCSTDAVSECTHECYIMFAVGQITVDEFTQKYMAAKKVCYSVA